MSTIQLSPVQARVLASLAEKSIATPQYYPMTANGIMLAANQKSSRRPIMQLKEGEVEAALNQLEQAHFCVRDTFSGRVQKWRHQFQHQLLLKPSAFAVLLTLILRGPQTRAELRANASVLGGPADEEGMTVALESLNDRAQPLVVLLPLEPGQKGARYAHCLCGAPESVPFDSAAPPESAGRDLAPQDPRLNSLEQRVSDLEARIASLERALGC